MSPLRAVCSKRQEPDGLGSVSTTGTVTGRNGFLSWKHSRFRSLRKPARQGSTASLDKWFCEIAISLTLYPSPFQLLSGFFGGGTTQLESVSPRPSRSTMTLPSCIFLVIVDTRGSSFAASRRRRRARVQSTAEARRASAPSATHACKLYGRQGLVCCLAT